MTRDPAGERAGVNLYEYLMNNAVTYIDGLGDVTVKVVTDGSTATRIIPRPYSRDQFLKFQLT